MLGDLEANVQPNYSDSKKSAFTNPARLPTLRAMTKRVLVVEDEPSISETILYALRTEQFEATSCATGQDALDLLGREAFDFVVLDVGLPDMSGFDVCRSIRQNSSAPILFLTARDGEIDRIVGLELGADDYVTKPFSPRELAARVRAILRRTQPSAAAAHPHPPVVNGNGKTFSHDDERKRILCRGQPLELSRNEYHLLLALMKHPGRVFSRDQLMDQAWQDPGAAGDRTVDAHIRSLRAKIRLSAPDIDPIETRRGIGYAFREPDAA